MPKKTIAIFIKAQDNHLVISIKAKGKRLTTSIESKHLRGVW